MDAGLRVEVFHQIFLNIGVIKGNPFITGVFGKEFTHNTFRKQPLVYIPLIIPDIPAQLCQKFGFGHRKRDIGKTGFKFELGRYGKA